MKVWIFGDSFSTNTSEHSWTLMVANALNAELHCLSQNGISEYRIYKIFMEYKAQFDKSDVIIVCHTNPLRIFIPNHVNYPSRKKKSHPYCDLVMADASRYWLWRLISKIYVQFFFDEEYHQTQFNLFFEQINKQNVINVSGFTTNSSIFSFNSIFTTNKGSINHMSIEGNKQVAYRILEKIYEIH